MVVVRRLLVAALIVFDIAYASRGERGRSVKKAWIWSLLWIGVALVFGAWIAIRLGSEAGLAYLTAYVLEKSLSIDNLAVFAVVFAADRRPGRAAAPGPPLGRDRRARHARAADRRRGIYALERFHWLVYPFGAPASPMPRSRRLRRSRPAAVGRGDVRAVQQLDIALHSDRRAAARRPLHRQDRAASASPRRSWWR